MKAINKNRIAFKNEDTIQVFRKGTTANIKIAAPGEIIIQSYTFSIDQFNYVKDQYSKGLKTDFKTFFSLDTDNCKDCPLSGNMRAKNSKLVKICYTNKVNQYSGFISMLKSIINQYQDLESIPVLDKDLQNKIVNLSKGLFVRFGSYGEPTMHSISLVTDICLVAKNWTGYTHQYLSTNYKYENYFMSSTHNQHAANYAKDKLNYRSFISYDKDQDVKGIICPASKEGNNEDANCSSCGLCSGNLGKGSKDVKIMMH